jgi:hypothetical protein
MCTFTIFDETSFEVTHFIFRFLAVEEIVRSFLNKEKHRQTRLIEQMSCTDRVFSQILVGYVLHRSDNIDVELIYLNVLVSSKLYLYFSSARINFIEQQNEAYMKNAWNMAV